MKAKFLILVAGLVSLASATAETVSLAWDPSPDTGVGAYRVHYGFGSGNYTQVQDAGLATTSTVSNLTQGVTYFFAVTAVGTNQLESEFSNELSYTVPLPSNAAPTITVISDQVVNEDGSLTGISFTVDDNETAPGSLVVSASSGNAGLIPNGNIALNGTGASRTVDLMPLPDASGTAQITIYVSDGELFSTATFALTVNSVNDRPTLASIGALVVGQNAGLQTVNLSGIGSGAANEAQTLVVSAVSSNPALIPDPAVTYGSPSNTGTLTLAPAGGQTGNATITVTVSDGGGTLYGGIESFQQSFLVTVVASPNVPPTLDAISDVTIVQAEGEPGLLLAAMGAGNTIWSLAAGGPAQSQAVSLTGIGTGGEPDQTVTLTATSSNPALVPDPVVSYASPNASGSLSLNPSVGATGSAVITVIAKDDGGGADTLQRTFTVNVAPPANTAPSVASVADQTMYEDAASSPLPILVSDAQTAADSLVVTASSRNPTLISDADLSMSGSGSTRSLSVQPQANQSGKAMITLQVTDGGGVMSYRSFWVHVNPVNDAPTLATPAGVTLAGGGAEQIELAGLGVGPLEPGQRLALVASSSNPQIIQHPEVIYYSPDTTARLQLSPVDGASGSATITVTVRDDGGTANGGQDTVTRTFTVTAPSAVVASSGLPDGEAVVQGAAMALPEPALQIHLERNTLVLAWDNSAGPYVLQRSSTPAMGGVWAGVEAPVEPAGNGRVQVAVPAVRPAEFFRLVRE